MEEKINTDKNFFYDDFSDRLFISCKKPSDKIVGSVRILNVILDFTPDMRIVNVELRRVSEFLSALKINPEILNNLEKAELIVQKYDSGYLIYFLLQSEGVLERIPFNILLKEKILAKS